jgi:hypothetical protein
MSENSYKIKFFIMLGIFILYLGFTLFMRYSGVDVDSKDAKISGNVVNDKINAYTTKNLDLDDGIEDNSVSSISNNNVRELDIKKDDFVRLVLSLRKSSLDNDITKIANFYVLVENQVTDFNDVVLDNSWVEISSCVYDGCSDDKFMSFLRSYLYMEKTDDLVLLRNLVDLYSLWGSNHISEFSNKLNEVNVAVVSLRDDLVEQKWTEFVSCGKSCSDSEEYAWDLISLLYE